MYSLVGQRNQWLKHSAQLVEPHCSVSEKGLYLQHTHGNHYDVVLAVESSSGEQRETTEKPFSICDKVQTGHKRK